MGGSFEKALTRRLYAELDALNVVPAAVPPYRRIGSVRYVWAVGRPLAVAIAAAVLLGSFAWTASGSPNPVNWVKAAGKSLGIPTSDGKTQIAPEKTPSPRTSESPTPEDQAQPTGIAHEPAETSSPEPVEHQTPEPGDHSSATPPGDG